MPPTTLLVNDTDLGTFGCWCDVPAGWGDAPSQTDRLTSVPGQAGALLLTPEADVGSRSLAINGVLIATDNATARANWDSVKAVLSSPVLEIRFEEYADRMVYGRYRSISWSPALWGQFGAPFTMQFVCPNPHPVARTVTVYTISAAASTTLTLGTAPSALDINIIGNGNVNPTITYTDAQGEVKGLLRFLMTLPTGEWIEWRGFHQTAVWHKVGNASANAIPLLDPESEPFAADPLDGDGTTGPTVSVTNAVATINFRKSWR